MRDEHQPREALVALLAGAEASKMLFMTFHTRGIVRLSLAATVRKMLHVHTPHYGTIELLNSNSKPVEQQQQQQPIKDLEAQAAFMGGEMAPLLDSLSQHVLDYPIGHWDQQRRKDNIEAGLLDDSEHDDADVLAPSPKANAHQLQAISLSSLVQVCRARICIELEEGVFVRGMTQPQWMDRAMLQLQDVPYPHLKLMVSAVLERSLRAVVTDRSVNTLWERYAVQHFHGRLLPGCCNMDCANLDGVCEQALRTLLCSGCRRARYCCLACQRAAWVEGGHSVVCSS